MKNWERKPFNKRNNDIDIRLDLDEFETELGSSDLSDILKLIKNYGEIQGIVVSLDECNCKLHFTRL